VEHDFDRLFSLFVADRLKVMLPHPGLNFILTAEANEPRCDRIASMADVYHAIPPHMMVSHRLLFMKVGVV